MNINISKKRLDSLFYYAHIGVSHKAREYKNRYPERKQPFAKLEETAKLLRGQGYYQC